MFPNSSTSSLSEALSPVLKGEVVSAPLCCSGQRWDSGSPKTIYIEGTPPKIRFRGPGLFPPT